jgi:hypothetical protein
MKILNGIIDLGSDVLAEPGLLETAFLASPIGPIASVFVNSGVHHSYKLQVMNVEGKNFLPLLYFTDGKLAEIHLHSVDESKTSWEAYSPQTEAVNKLDNDNWLKQVLGSSPPYKFPWGLIESIFDQKGGMSFILFRYSQS